MSPDVGSVLTLDVVKPAAGGRMLARHEGQVVLVAAAIPGERVRARVERVGKGVLYAMTEEVIVASPARRASSADWQCGGNAYAHIAYDTQRLLKGDILRDALERIGRLPLEAAPDVVGSPEQGYRMRARLHVRDGRLGFYREGTHELCDAAATGQLLPETSEWIATVERLIARERLTSLAVVEVAENIPASERACHLELHAGADARAYRSLIEDGGLAGISMARGDDPVVERVGNPSVCDVLHIRPGDPGSALRLRRDVRAFFQGNRFLLEPLVRHVISLVPPGPVVDLYAGVGLFGLTLSVSRGEPVTLVEGDGVSGASLADNAEPFQGRVSVERRSVEAFLADVPRLDAWARTQGVSPTYIVDPPRTGMSRAAMAAIVGYAPARVVYVSCDVATFARDTRTLLDAGYELQALTGFDLFPNTAHVEAVAAFTKPSKSARNSPVR